MTKRAVFAVLACAFGSCALALASQPSGPAGKLVPNPIVVQTIGGEDNGLPGVACGGFTWYQILDDTVSDPAAPIVLELAIVPFRSRATDVIIGDATRHMSLASIRFDDGDVRGLRYRRFYWNDVVVTLRPLTQDYVLSVNGMQAGPFPFADECQPAGGCFGVGSVVVNGGFGAMEPAWLDSLTLVRQGTEGEELLLDLGFDQCYMTGIALGGLLIVDPPRWLDPMR